MLVLLMGGIYELRHLDGLTCHDKRTKFNDDWLRHSKVVKGDTHTDSHTHTQTAT
jgi:hypothetical protein